MNNRSDYFSLSGRTFKEFRNEVNRFEKNLVFRRVKMGEIYFSIMPKKPGTGTEGIPMTQKNWDLYCETFETGAEFKPERTSGTYMRRIRNSLKRTGSGPASS